MIFLLLAEKLDSVWFQWMIGARSLSHVSVRRVITCSVINQQQTAVLKTSSQIMQRTRRLNDLNVFQMMNISECPESSSTDAPNDVSLILFCLFQHGKSQIQGHSVNCVFPARSVIKVCDFLLMSQILEPFHISHSLTWQVILIWAFVKK